MFRKILCGQMIPLFPSKVPNLTVFSNVYLIRVRFFGPWELIQNELGAARYCKGNMLCAAHLCAWFGRPNSRREKSTGFLFWVMVLLWSVWVCVLLFFCVQVWTEQLGWRIWGSPGGRDHNQKLHPQTQKQIQRRARTKSTITKIDTGTRAQKKKNSNKIHVREVFIFVRGPVCANTTTTPSSSSSLLSLLPPPPPLPTHPHTHPHTHTPTTHPNNTSNNTPTTQHTSTQHTTHNTGFKHVCHA